MKTNIITARLPRIKASSYPIIISARLLQQIPKWLPNNFAINNVVIITDYNVNKLYASLLKYTLQKKGYKTFTMAFKAGEKSKTYQTKQAIESKMLRHHFDRHTLILALGGGVVGDLAGFIAATYMRGIAYLQIPTTLLAMVDSSVGGKTGINTEQGKNLIGAFWQPQAVLADIVCLKSLSRKNIINGFIEALKMFLTNDRLSFYYAKKNLQNVLSRKDTVLKQIIYRAVRIKADVIAKDAKEINQRKILNFGHTIGHALEQISDYKMLHGYAVAFGILVEAKIAQLLGYLDNKKYLIVRNVLADLGIVGKQLNKFSIEKIVQATRRDKKVRGNEVYYILIADIGRVHVVGKKVAHPVSDKVVKRAFMEVIKD